MKKKITVTFLIAILICTLIPITAFADSHNVHDGETFDLSGDGINLGDIIQIDAGATATLTGTAPENVRVVCGSGVNLTIDDVILNCSTDFFCALEFTGGNNFLTLEGVSNIKGGEHAVGIGVPEGVSLTINGEGKVISTGKDSGAGIGGGFCENAGTIIIDSGTVVANSSFGAGIGSSINQGYEEITINGGTIRVSSGDGAGIGSGMTSGIVGPIYINGGDIEVNNTGDGAGIGGGKYANIAATIKISGGTIRANASSGAGIGRGVGWTLWDVEISGGTIFANSNEGAGIGGGNIQISGGEVYASSNNAHDVGKTGDTLSVSGDALVFLENEQAGSLIPNTTTHFYYDYANSSEVPAKYSIPTTWCYPIGLYRKIKINLVPKTTTLGFSETCVISATTEPAGYPIAFYSSDPFVADVDPVTGEVTAGMKEGRVVITAICRESSYECIVYVVDKSEPAPKPSDPENTVSVELKDDKGDPMAGVAVSLFSEPQTVMTDSNGIAVFQNVPYNTNDPHTLIIQDFRGMEIGRYNLSFTSGAANSATVVGDDISVVFNNTITNTILTFTTREGSVQDIAVRVDTSPIAQKVENPQTGDFESGSLTTIYLSLLIVCAIVLLIYFKMKNRGELVF